MAKKYFKLSLKYLPSISLIAAAIYFFNLDFDFDFRKIGLLYLCLSFVFILLFFFIKSFTWFKLLARYEIDVPLGLALYSHFKTIFTKYIPGKIWILISSASIISRQGYSLKKVSELSLLHLLIQTVAGLTVGIFGLLLFDIQIIPPVLALLILAAMVSFVILITVKKKIPGLHLIRRIPRLQSVQFIELKPVVDLIIISTIQWGFLGIAYYFLLLSLNFDVGFEPILLQPLANNIGIIVPITPGGIGVREYAMIGYLSTLIDVKEAGNFAIFSRIWFFIAELMIFGISFIQSHIDS